MEINIYSREAEQSDGPLLERRHEGNVPHGFASGQVNCVLNGVAAEVTRLI